MRPLQSLSALSQTSADGVPPVTEQVVPVPVELQMYVPVRAQAPVPAVQTVPRPPVVPLLALRTTPRVRAVPSLVSSTRVHPEGNVVMVEWYELDQLLSDESVEPTTDACALAHRHGQYQRAVR